ncbi:MAG: adenylate kinase [Anaerolineales bacterium]|nr:adenylate kinase [Anaerolineales bacterium]
MPKYIVLLGPPGAGKGTQAQKISSSFGYPHVSSGELFREHLKNQTQLGKLAQGYIERGELVPDDVTIAMIRERLTRPDCEQGAILDGFPRTAPQAEALSAMLAELGGKVDLVPYINVPTRVLVERLAGRWTCREQGHIFHETSNPPRQPGKCDVDGSELYQREDDQAETVLKRIQVYLSQTTPLIEHYRSQGVLVEVNGALPIDQVTQTLSELIEKEVLV